MGLVPCRRRYDVAFELQSRVTQVNKIVCCQLLEVR
ncbi:hypothetical protein PD5205_03560 [Xanthomonas fragariae]|uniref:Uncharacterized protein n=1 Tax=Xanthomonas fragariae TaxID=48664 RepID=A0A1Y6HMU3_9XANT|nr:hypothetical protein NBC2815_00517 [Xanthomonas fragariae]SMQ97702.1 hypothetical protein PD885_00433 [Xanthomonas fragariae]SMR04835.1 hypothetical protein PD5205_03560 [Xanthomonas fragariae]